ncbi:hypothetical protein Tco_1531354 [Tanacetum coccineum]
MQESPSHHPDHHSSSSSSSSDSSPVHSLGLDAPDQAHSGSSTRDVSPRLRYPPRRAPRRSEAYRRWCAAPLSTLYPPPPTIIRPSRKRCRSPVDSVSLSMPVTGSLAPTRADHLPPRKRFRDSYSSEASLEEDAEVGLTGTGVDMELEEIEADPPSAGDTTEAGIDPMTAPDGIVKESGRDTPVDLSDVFARLENLKVRAMLDIERDRVSSLRLHMSFSQEEFRQIRRDRGRYSRETYGG